MVSVRSTKPGARAAAVPFCACFVVGALYGGFRQRVPCKCYIISRAAFRSESLNTENMRTVAFAAVVASAAASAPMGAPALRKVRLWPWCDGAMLVCLLQAVQGVTQLRVASAAAAGR